MKNNSKKAPTKSALKFSTDSTDKADFFQFKNAGENFLGRFKQIRPETDVIQGIDLEEIDGETLESKGLKTLPAYHNLVKYFEGKQPDDNIVYQITVQEIKKLDGGRQVYLFEVATAKIDEAEND